MSPNKRVKGKIELTYNDWMLLDLVKTDRKRYKIVVDNDIVWVEDLRQGEVAGDFSSYGDALIVAILESMGINVEYC